MIDWLDEIAADCTKKSAPGRGWDRHADPLHDDGHIKLWTERKMRQLLHENNFEQPRFARLGRDSCFGENPICLRKIAALISRDCASGSLQWIAVPAAAALSVVGGTSVLECHEGDCPLLS